MVPNFADSEGRCACCERWTGEEGAALGEGRLDKQALLKELGLREPERMSFDEIRRIAAFDRAFGTHPA
jgi:hypothetical protein